MKKLLLIILFINCLNKADAQSRVYHPFPTDSATWTNENATWNLPPGWPIVNWPPPYLTYNAPDRYCMGSQDTIINLNTYSMIHYCGGAYKGALRDQSGKIYFVPADSLNELLLYDFTANTGDGVTVYSQLGGPGYYQSSSYTISNVDSVLINGSYRKRLWLDQGYWIEGIGNTNGLFMENWPNVSNYYIELSCMSEGLNTLYPSFSAGACSLHSGVDEYAQGADPVEIFPNPGSGLFQLKWENTDLRMIEIYNLQGAKIKTLKLDKNALIDLSEQPDGIYFFRVSDSKGNSVAKKVVKQ